MVIALPGSPENAPPPPAVEVIDLWHRFGNAPWSLAGVSLRIEAGALVLIAGSNGSGKTTLLRHLNGLLLPTKGEVRIHGVSVSGNVAHARRQVGMVFQDADWQIVADSVAADAAFGPENLRLAPGEIERRVAEALAAVGLSGMEARNPLRLSGGEKRRLAIAGILAMGSRVMVLDEPFSNLDYTGLRQVREQLLRLKAAGHTLLVASHDFEALMDAADLMVVMEQGMILRQGPVEALAPELAALGLRPVCTCRPGAGPAK